MQTLLDRDQLACLEARLYSEDDYDSFFHCHALISISPHQVVQANHMRITDDTIMLKHNAGMELFGNAAFLKKISDILGIQFAYRDRWGADFVELVAT